MSKRSNENSQISKEDYAKLNDKSSSSNDAGAGQSNVAPEEVLKQRRRLRAAAAPAAAAPAVSDGKQSNVFGNIQLNAEPNKAFSFGKLVPSQNNAPPATSGAAFSFGNSNTNASAPAATNAFPFGSTSINASAPAATFSGFSFGSSPPGAVTTMTAPTTNATSTTTPTAESGTSTPRLATPPPSSSSGATENTVPLEEEVKFWNDKVIALKKQHVEYVRGIPLEGAGCAKNAFLSLLLPHSKLQQTIAEARERRPANTSEQQSQPSTSTPAAFPAATATAAAPLPAAPAIAPFNTTNSPSTTAPKPFSFPTAAASSNSNTALQSPAATATSSSSTAFPSSPFSPAGNTQQQNNNNKDSAPVDGQDNNGDNADTTEKAQASVDPLWEEVGEFEPVAFLKYIVDKEDKTVQPHWKSYIKKCKMRIQKSKTLTNSFRMVVWDELVGRVKLNMQILKNMTFDFKTNASKRSGEYGMITFVGMNDQAEGMQKFCIKAPVDVAQRTQQELERLAAQANA